MTKSFLPTALGLFLVPMALTACVTDEVIGYGDQHNDANEPGTSSTSACAAATSCLGVADASWAGAACIAMADNAGATRAQLRVSQLQVASPEVLTKPFMQTTIITEGITPTIEDAGCRQLGSNRFNILFDFDFEKMEMKQGASIPQILVGHEVGAGTCWADYSELDPSEPKSKIRPAVAPLTYDEATGAFEATFATMNVPIYVADTEDDFALLPLHELRVTGNLSAGNSCIGKFLAENLEAPTCAAGDSGFRWQNDGDYVGYVTVVEADDVDVSSLGFSLCTLLSGDSVKWKNNADGIGRCVDSKGYRESGNNLPEGNWCSVDNSANPAACGGVLDSWQLKTKFAASAIKIDGICPKGG